MLYFFDQNLLLKGDRLPLADASVDTLIADYVLEHIQDPHAFEVEVFRVLKTGGIFCARTPHSWNYVSIGARLVRNKKHADVLAKMQPDRKVMDVFPTAYRANSMRAIRRLWPSDRWIDHSYLYSAEPKYHFGSRTIYRVFSVLHNLLPAPLVGNIFVFLVKR